MSMKKTYSDGKGKRFDAMAELYQAEQSLREKIKPHFENIMTLHSDMVREQNKYFKEELETGRTMTMIRNMNDYLDKTEHQVYKRSEILGLKETKAEEAK